MVKTYSIQEMLEKTEKQRKAIEASMDKEAIFHPSDANLFMNQKRSVRRELSESLTQIPLRKIMEYLAKSGTADVAGAAYLVPDKLESILIHASKKFDIVPLISMRVVTGWAGGDLDVAIANSREYKAKRSGSGGGRGTSTVGSSEATISPIAFSTPALITEEMIEDSQFEIVEWHIEQAGKAHGATASDLALNVLKTATDGDGTKETKTTDTTDNTKFSEVMEGFELVSRNHWVANTLVTTPASWFDEIVLEANATTRHPVSGVVPNVIAEGFDMKLQMLDTLFSASDELHDSTDVEDAAFTTCISLVFDRANAMLTGRKRWLAVENYAKPIEDLAGAVISSRQGSVTIYNDSICIITEKT